MFVFNESTKTQHGVNTTLNSINNTLIWDLTSCTRAGSIIIEYMLLKMQIDGS